jgi:signal transduction histidine kinase
MRRLLTFGKQTLKVRLTIWYILLLGASLLLFSSYLYLQLQKSLLTQLDTALLVTASQTLNDLVEEDGHPAFKTTISSQALAQRLANGGFVVRLLAKDGTVWDGFGNYESLPIFFPSQVGYSNIKEHDTFWRVYSQTINSNKGDHAVEGCLQVAQSLKPVAAACQHLFTLSIIGFPLVLIIAGVGGFFIVDRALRPINKIIDIAEAINPNDFNQRIGYQGLPDEVGRLATTFDRMLDRMQLAFERERRFTGDASHELRTPLTVIKGRIGVTLSRNRSAEEYENTLRDLDSEADRLIRLTNGLLFLARLAQEEQNCYCGTSPSSDAERKLPHSCCTQTIDLSNLLSVLVEQMLPLADQKNIHVNENIYPDLEIKGNADYLTSLFLNLLDNAVKYTPCDEQILVEAKSQENEIQVQVINTGNAIPPEHLPHLFDRFYRVEGARSRVNGGAGLGLAIAYEISRLHGGDMTVESEQKTESTIIGKKENQNPEIKLSSPSVLSAPHYSEDRTIFTVKFPLVKS